MFNTSLFKRLMFCLLILSICSISSCSSSGDVPGTSPELDYPWNVTFYTPRQNISSFSLTSDGEYIYYTTFLPRHPLNVKTVNFDNTAENTEYYRWKIGSEEPEKIDAITDITRSAGIVIQPDGLGNLFVAEPNGMISKYDGGGNCLFSISADFTADNVLRLTAATDGDGRLYIAANDGLGSGSIYIFSAGGDLLSVLPDTASFITNTPDGSVYCTAGDGSILSIKYGTEPSAAYTDCGSAHFLTAYLDKGLLINFSDSLYLLDFETGTLQELFMWANLGINYSDVRNICVLSDGSIAAALSEETFGNTTYEIAYIYKAPQTKQVLTLGTFSSSVSLASAVTEFNRTSTEYRIEIKQYYDPMTDRSVGGTGYQDALTRFHLDIASGDCPDLRCIDYDSLSTYADKGLLENLSPYLEKSGIEILDSVKSGYTFDGELAAIPPLVQLRTIVGRSDVLSGLDSWTLEEMIEFAEAYPDKNLFNVSPERMLNICLSFNLSKFVDFAGGTCSFETEAFCKVLSFCKGYAGRNKVSSENLIDIADYDALLYEVTLYTPADYTALVNFYEGSDIAFIGYPCDSGCGAVLEDYKGAYSISALSEHKDAAWSFIEQLLLSGVSANASGLGYGYPSANTIREAYFESVMSEPWTEPEEGEKPERRVIHSTTRSSKKFIYYVPFESELQAILELLDGAETTTLDSTVMEIILENAADYFSEEKTAEETAKQIQSRVKIYLSEKN